MTKKTIKFGKGVKKIYIYLAPHFNYDPIAEVKKVINEYELPKKYSRIGFEYGFMENTTIAEIEMGISKNYAWVYIEK